MASMQDQLISRLIKEGQPAYQQAREWGLTGEDVNAGQPNQIWKAMEEYYTSMETRGSLPGPATIAIHFPNFQLCDDASMTLAALCQEVRKERLRRQLKSRLTDSIQEAEFDPLTALNSLKADLGPLLELGATKKTDVVFASEFSNILKDYQDQVDGKYVTVGTWPWDAFQDATGGISKDDFIVFYGRPKSMKTWIFCFILSWLYQQGKSILVYTKEMSPRNIFKRMAACLAEIPYQELRSARLSPGDRSKLQDIEHLISDPKTSPLIALSAKDVSAGGDTPAWLRAKVEKYMPEIVGIDGMYLMSDGKGGKSADWSRVTTISREISAMRLDLEVPVIATMQANRKAAGHSNAELDELAYADAVGQDATLACRVINEKGKPTIALVVGGSREFYLHGVRVGGVPATDFLEKELMTEKEVIHAKENDASKEDADNPAAHAKPRKNPKTNGAANLQDDLFNQQLKNIS